MNGLAIAIIVLSGLLGFFIILSLLLSIAYMISLKGMVKLTQMSIELQKLHTDIIEDIKKR